MVKRYDMPLQPAAVQTSSAQEFTSDVDSAAIHKVTKLEPEPERSEQELNAGENLSQYMSLWKQELGM